MTMRERAQFLRELTQNSIEATQALGRLPTVPMFGIKSARRPISVAGPNEDILADAGLGGDG